MKKIVVFGAGSWGTALAQLLASRGREVILWARNTEQIRAMTATGHNPKHLRNFDLSPHIEFTSNLEEAAQASPRWVAAVPTQSLRELTTKLALHAPEELSLCNVAKGIEISTGMRPSQIVAEKMPRAKYSILSGPSHAEEIMTGEPAAVVVAGPPGEAGTWQTYFMTPRFRVYTSQDITGVEIGAAVKNVIAIGTGIARAMGQGDNAVAALVTRGLAEIMRLGARMGANPLTLSGLAGVGDLMVTCYSMHSRNYRLGLELGKNIPFEEAVKHLGEVAEGAYTVRALTEHAEQLGVELPICRAVHKVIYGGAEPQKAMGDLLLRSPKPEFPAMLWS